MNDKNDQSIASPCIGVCVLNNDDVCTGCFRNVAEIARWASAPNDEKREIIVRSWERARASGRVL